MKNKAIKQILILLFPFLSCFFSTAQDAIYTFEKTIISGKIIGFENNELIYIDENSSKVSHIDLKKIYIVFNDKGNYLLVEDYLQNKEKQADYRNDFLNSPLVLSKYDMIISFDNTVTRCEITYEGADAINYKKKQTGSPGTKNKRDILMILYHTGKHKIIPDDFTSKSVEFRLAREEIKEKLLEDIKNEVKLPVTIAEPKKEEPKPPIIIAEPKKEEPKPPVIIAELKKEEPIQPVVILDSKKEEAKPIVAVEPEKKEITKPVEYIQLVEEKKIEPRTPPAKPAKPTLTEAQYKEYSNTGQQKVVEFENILKIITDKEKDQSEKDNAIKQALELFTPNATIEVSQKMPDGTIKVNPRKVGAYLKSLKFSSYSAIEMGWTDVHYVSELSQETDGNYYGTIRGTQRFKGYDATGNIKYEDETTKDVKVMVKSYIKTIDAIKNQQWNVLLGNIGIVETK